MDRPTELSLRPYVARAAAAGVANSLERLCVEGARPQAVAALLELVVRDRETRRTVEELLDLVATGPEASDADHRDTRIVVENLFSAAEQSVLVVGYAVYKARQVFQALARRMEVVPNLHVRMFLDVQRARLDTSGDEDVLRGFCHRFRTREWPGERMPEVYFDPRSLHLDPETRASLHAKCIVVDRAMAFVSSANFTSAAQLRNIEIGVLIRSASFAERLAAHFDGLVGHGAVKRLVGV